MGFVRRLGKKKYSSGKGKAFFFSERSGTPFRYSERVKEPGTGLIVHRSESDGIWNRVDWPKDVIVPGDAQNLKDARPGPTASFFED